MGQTEVTEQYKQEKENEQLKEKLSEYPLQLKVFCQKVECYSYFIMTVVTSYYS